MFDTKKYTKNNGEAQKVLGELKLNEVITDEQYYAIKKALDDGKYTICEGTFANQNNEGEVIGHLLEDFVNGAMGRQEKESLIHYLTTSMHRYLQGEFFKFVMQYINTIAKLPDFCFDPRNQFTKTIAKAIAENTPEYFEFEDSFVPEWTRR